MADAPRRPGRHSALRYFWAIFLPLALLALGAGAAMVAWQRVGERNRLRVEETARLTLAARFLDGEVERAASDLLLLAGEDGVRQALDRRDDPRAVAAGARELLRIAQLRSLYDRVRLLDGDGFELIRFQRRGEDVLRAPDSELSDRGSRDYLAAARSLVPGEILVSWFELSTDGGLLDPAPKPVLRLVTPPPSGSEASAGYLVLTLSGEDLIARLRGTTAGLERRVLVAEASGRWIAGPSVQDAWAALHPGREARTVEFWDRELWSAIEGQARGDVPIRGGLAVFRRFRFGEGLTLPTGHRLLSADRRDRDASWLLIIHSPISSAVPGAGFWLAELAVLSAFGGLAGWLARLARERREAVSQREASLAFMERVADTIPSPIYVKSAAGNYLGCNRAFEEATGFHRDELIGKGVEHLVGPEAAEAFTRRDAELLSQGGVQVYEAEVSFRGGPLRTYRIHRAVYPGADGGRGGIVSALIDVTELRGAQRALAASEKRFRGMIDSALDLVVILDADGRHRFVSPAIEGFLGRAPQSLIGRSVLEHLHPEDAPKVRALFAEFSGRIGPVPVEPIRLRHADGGYRWLEVSVNNQLGEEGIDGILVVARDVSHRIELERQVVESRAVLELLIEHMPVMIAAADKAKNVVFWNRQCERVTGFSKEQAVGRSPIELLIPDSERPALIEDLRRRRGRFHDLEVEIVPREGDRRTIAWTSFEGPVRVTSWPYWVIGVDVTERRNAERAREEASGSLREWLEKLQRINEMDDTLTACKTLPEAFQVIPSFLADLFPATSGALHVRDGPHGELEAQCRWGQASFRERLRVDDCWALRLGRTQVSGRFGGRGLRCAHLREHGGEALCVPVLSQGEVTGLLEIRGPASGELRPDAKEQLAHSVAGHLGLRLAALRLREELLLSSTRDPLTRLYNRRYMEETFDRELERARRADREVGVVLVDLDHFKRLNDTWGHEAGDAALRQVAGRLVAMLRRDDVVCRYGGEEFVVILPNAPRAAVEEKARTIVEEIRKLGSTPPVEALRGITASAGLSTFPLDGDDPQELLRAADDALYRAKRAGRDRVCVAQGGARSAASWSQTAPS